MKFPKSSTWILVISMLLNIVLGSLWMYKNNQAEAALARVAMITQNDLVELESAIAYEVEHEWKEESIILEKIEDVLQDLYTITATADEIGVLTEEQEAMLDHLRELLSGFPAYTGFPNTELSDSQRKDLEKLADSLRRAGWGMNLSYSGDWQSFERSARLLTDYYDPG
ncbi:MULTISPECIES: hypothetical protein [Paenibacillus]|uniref:hypothetical protein n=1 Tax=Paenibacillus TaxID=44249 RepID=UPI0022B8A9F9|nr:hypothetical protein [Paenibacillus caseinilyticus]MCZ8521941.1 hypothetical protein [Paenibacillus caseinilyticus]